MVGVLKGLDGKESALENKVQLKVKMVYLGSMVQFSELEVHYIFMWFSLFIYLVRL